VRIYRLRWSIVRENSKIPLELQVFRRIFRFCAEVFDLPPEDRNFRRKIQKFRKSFEMSAGPFHLLRNI